jgi:hypothetical protein
MRKEGYSHSFTERIIATEEDLFDSIVVSKEYLFEMVDNRDNSIDGRPSELGLVSVDAIIGIPVVRIWSKSRNKIQKIR